MNIKKKKLVILISIFIIMLFSTFFYINKDFIPEKVDYKDKNVPNYFVAQLGESGPGFEHLKRVYSVIDNKVVNYNLNKDSAMSINPDVNDKGEVILLSFVNCVVKVFDQKGNYKARDLCELPNVPKIENGAITREIMYINNYMLFYIDGAFQNKGYRNSVRIMDNDFNYVTDYSSENIILSYFLKGNKLYTVEGSQKAPLEEMDKIYVYDIKSKKREIFFDNKEKINVSNIVFEKDDCYLFYDNWKEKNGLLIAKYKNGSLEKISNSLKAKDRFSDKIMIRNDGVYMDQNNTDDQGAGYLRIHNGKLYENYNVCKYYEIYYGKNHYYCTKESADSIIKYKYNEKQGVEFKTLLPFNYFRHVFAFYD